MAEKETVLDQIGLWFYEIVYRDKELSEYASWCEEAMAELRPKISLKNQSLEKASMEMPGLMEQIFHMWQEAEAILEDLDTQLAKTKRGKYMEFKKTYNREMGVRDMDKFIDGEPDIVAIKRDKNLIGYLRNQIGGLSKALDAKHFQIGHITKMRVAGLNDSEIKF